MILLINIIKFNTYNIYVGNMDKINESIKALKESGEYFSDSIRWYERKYLYVIAERSYLILLSIIFIVGLIISYYNINNLLPMNKKVEFAIFTDNSLDYYSRILKLQQKDDLNTEELIAKYLINYYVIMRENYDFNNLKEQEEYIKNNSSKQAFKNFKNYMSLTNVNSPILVFQKRIKKSIKITSIDFPQEYNYGMTPEYAVVKFIAKVYDPLSGITRDSTWLANVNFYLPNIKNVINNRSSFQFIVNDYRVQQIK